MENKMVSGINNNIDELEVSKQYGTLLENTKINFNYMAKEYSLFKIKTGNLYDIFLENIPEEYRQHYNCHTCRGFVNKYGSIVRINDDGRTIQSVLWDIETTPDFFKPAIGAMLKEISKGRIDNIFITNKTKLGVEFCGGFDHFSVEYNHNPNKRLRSDYLVKTIAENLEKFKMVNNAILDYSLDTVHTATVLLESGNFYRADVCIEISKAFEKLLKDISTTKNKLTIDRMIWNYVANVPAGACHIKSSMIGTLLDDIKDGLDLDDIERRFADKVNPVNYMRPKAAPTVGNIKRAEELIKELGLEKSLKRRFADITELTYFWRPEENNKSEDNISEEFSIFGHLLPKEESKDNNDLISQLPPLKMSWVVFERDILPKAKRLFINGGYSLNNRVVFVTAYDPEAKPIIKWDKEEGRNPISLYFYNQKTPCSKWNIETGFNEVYGLSELPEHYNCNTNNEHTHICVIKGMKDLIYKDTPSGTALFPEILIPELREIRSTIEAYSNNDKLFGYDEYQACGLAITNGTVLMVEFEDGNKIKYTIDRYE